jgi:hypothetical protein
MASFCDELAPGTASITFGCWSADLVTDAIRPSVEQLSTGSSPPHLHQVSGGFRLMQALGRRLNHLLNVLSYTSPLPALCRRGSRGAANQVAGQLVYHCLSQ